MTILLASECLTSVLSACIKQYRHSMEQFLLHLYRKKREAGGAMPLPPALIDTWFYRASFATSSGSAGASTAPASAETVGASGATWASGALWTSGAL